MACLLANIVDFDLGIRLYANTGPRNIFNMGSAVDCTQISSFLE